MSSQQESTAVAVARAHVDAWGVHDYDVARGALAPEVHVMVTSVDPNSPQVDTTGVEEYRDGLIQFGQAVLPGTTRVISASGDDQRAMVQVTSRVKFGPDAAEMTLMERVCIGSTRARGSSKSELPSSSRPSDVAIGDGEP